MLVRIAGVLAVLLALYVLVGEQLVGTSSEAFVNARLAEIRAPVSGVVEISALQSGDRVNAGQQIGNITSRQTATQRTRDLRRELALAEADREGFEDNSGYTASTGSSSLAIERQRAENRATALRDLLDAQLDAQGTDLSAGLTSPTSGIIWSLRTDTGQFAVEGQVLANVLDCSSRFVHASVDRSVYNELSVGDAVQFRPHGAGETVSATITLLAGTGPRTLLDTLAIAPTESQKRGYTVLLEVPGLASSRCDVGRTGRVVFSEGPLSFVAALRDWFGS